ncbi:kinase-like protein, partial [Rhizophagus irregularis]
HPNNILIHKDTIKLADFGRSCQKGSANHTEAACGVIPYMDPKFFEENHSYHLTEKSDIYGLGVLFWELTSRLSPFDFENKNKLEIIQIKQDILNGKREIPIPNTNDKFVSLYKECWRHNPDERPSICKVIEVLDNINPIDLVVPKNNNVSTDLNSNKSESTENEDSDLPSCEEYDINSDRYNI